MTGWLLDTNVVSELLAKRASPRVLAWAAAQPGSSVYISVLTLAEYDKGITSLSEGDHRRQVYAAMRDEVERRFAGRVLTVSDPVVRRWGLITGEVRRRTGHPPAVIDTLLAATAIERGLTFVTRNVRDVQLSGAALLNPWTD